MKKVVTFGEIMMRLNPPGYLRLKQAHELEVTFAGGESNVAVSVANYGLHSTYVTKLPEGDIGQCAVNELRRQGVKAGLLRICMFRPFPAGEIREALKNVPVVGVVDRSAGLGAAQPPAATEVSAALRGAGCRVFSFVGGLAGRDISDGAFKGLYSELLDVFEGQAQSVNTWFDLKGDPMALREVDIIC